MLLISRQFYNDMYKLIKRLLNTPWSVYLAFLQWYRYVCKHEFLVSFDLTTVSLTQTNGNYCKVVASDIINFSKRFILYFVFCSHVLRRRKIDPQISTFRHKQDSSIYREHTARANLSF